jgi:hypothetical protein
MTTALQELEQLLPDLPKAIERRHLGDSLRRTVEILSDSSYQTRRLSAVLQIAKETEFASDHQQSAALSDLVEVAADVARRASTAETSEQLQTVKETYEEFRRTLAGVDRQLRINWRRVVERDFSSYIAIGGLLEKIEKTSDLGARLKACGQEAAEIRDSISAEDLSKAISHVRERRAELERKRGKLTQQPEVATFLNALADDSATLQMVTKRVYDWLAENGALDNFKVSALS